MARTVREIMNSELFGLAPSEKADAALAYLLALDITGAPVLGEEGRPIGMVSLRDLVRCGEHETVEDRMSRPVLSIGERDAVEEAGRLIGESDCHRLVVVDEEGRATGNVSALDVVRALLGMPARHPASFPHQDPETGLSWTDDTVLDMEHVELAPDAPGMLVLVQGGAGMTERPVWAELTHNVRTRLIDMLSLPQEQPRLREILERPNLRFRASRGPSFQGEGHIISPSTH